MDDDAEHAGRGILPEAPEEGDQATARLIDDGEVSEGWRRKCEEREAAIQKFGHPSVGLHVSLPPPPRGSYRASTFQYLHCCERNRVVKLSENVGSSYRYHLRHSTAPTFHSLASDHESVHRASRAGGAGEGTAEETLLHLASNRVLRWVLPACSPYSRIHVSIARRIGP